MEIARSHEVEFYSDDAAFVVGVTRFIEAALESGTAVIVVATDSHRRCWPAPKSRNCAIRPHLLH
jgi:hypothetical protein